MRRFATGLLLAALLAAMPAPLPAQDSPLFTGRTADMWLVGGETGQVTGYDTGMWMLGVRPEDFTKIDLGASDVLLINRLQGSSARITAGQPVISLAGIGDAALFPGEGGDGGHRDLTVMPASGTFGGTIAVNIGVSTSLLDDGIHRLAWTVVETGSGTTVINDGVMLAKGAGGTGENGYYKHTFYLVNDGSYSVSVILQGANVDTSEAREYELVIPPGEQRRDTDGDGIPDAVEVDMGLNPLEDDLLADTDGNGWSQFDEWLRRYCLDPNTLQPLDGAAACLDADGLPLDTDADNWTDFDEILRGTNHLDPEPVILEQPAAPAADDDDGTPPPAPGPAEPGSEFVERQRLRYKDFPAANRLYEVEYRLDAGAGTLSVPPLANIVLDQQSAGGTNPLAYPGIVVQSFTPAQDNIAGIDFRVAANTAADGVDDIYFNIWAGSLRDGELLLAMKLEQVQVNGDPDRPLVVRFEPVAVQPGQPVFFEFRKGDAALVSTGADTLGGGGVVEIDGAPASGATDLVLDVYYDTAFANGIGGTRASMQWWNIAAADLDGVTAYDATTLLRPDEIASSGLAPTDIAPRRRMDTLATAFGSSSLPAMRLPAGNSIVVSAVLRNQVPVQEGWQVPADYSRIYKNWLPRNDDITPLGMLAEMGEGSWTTPAEWRREFIAYLVPRLVLPVGMTLDESTSLAVAVVEAALSEEARIDGSGGLQLLTRVFQPGQPVLGFQPGQPIYGSLLTDESPFVKQWEDNLERLSAGSFNLDQSFAAVVAALGPGAPLDAVGQWLRERFYAGVPGTASDSYLAQQFLIAFPDVCKVPSSEVAERMADVDGWNEFLNQCPAWVDDEAYAPYAEDLLERCYLVRLNLLPGASPEIGSDATLLDREADSDSDGAPNAGEIENPVRQLTIPWLFDSDGDSIADSVDPCPNDPYNDCSANPIRPAVTLDGDFAVYEPATGVGYALVSVQLERIYDVPVTVCYEAIMDLGDTATADVDFEAVTGCVTIEPGKLSALIEIPINADAEIDAGETFTVRITSIDNGAFGDDGVVVITLNDPLPVANTPPVFTSGASISTADGDTATGYTATAFDADGDTLAYSISGGADQGLFVIDSATGVLSFVDAPDFDAPADADGDNDYELQLTVDDGNSGTATLDLVVSVVEANIYVEVSFPTQNANLGGGLTTTAVTGNVVDPLGAPIDPADINFIDVNGVLATLDAGNPGRWSAQVPVVGGPNVLTVTLERSDGSTSVVDVDVDNFVLHPGFDDIALDSANDRALVVDGWVNGILAVDLTTGERTVLSGNGAGSGTAFSSPRDVVLDAPNNRALVVDWQRDALYAVDLASGERTIVSNDSTGTGSRLDGPQSLALDAAGNRALVATTIEPIIYAVDLATGDRTVFSSGGTGTGPAFDDLRHIVIDTANSRALVSDDNLSTIFAVDLGSGNRTIISDPATGSGVALSSPDSLTLDGANNRLLVGEISGWVTAVDLATGDREIFVDLRPEFEVNNVRIDGVAVDAAQGRLLVSESRQDKIYAFDLVTGERATVTENRTGTGTAASALWGIQGLDFDAGNNQVVLTRSGNPDRLVSIDVGTAARAVVTGGPVGAGPTFNFPQGIDVDTAANRAILAGSSNNAIFAVDLATGERSVLADNFGAGTGPQFISPADLAIDPVSGYGVVLNGSPAVLRLELGSGDRSTVSDGTTGSGPLWSFPTSIALDSANDTAYVMDYTTDVLYRVDLLNGDRTIVADNTGIGTGVSLDIPNDMELDAANNRILYVDQGGLDDRLVAVNLATGDRTLISSQATGSGTSFLSPHDIALDAANDRVFIFDVAVTGVIVVDLASGQRAIASKY